MKTLAERFWAKVDMRGDDECWPWLGSKRRNGYGSFRTINRRVSIAHRVAWEFAFGAIPHADGHNGMCVCHSCDNPGCCNPKHLFLGPHAKNIHDRHLKNRDARQPGEANGRAKLTESDVIEILLLPEISERKCGAMFGVSNTSIRRIRIGKTWKHLTT